MISFVSYLILSHTAYHSTFILLYYVHFIALIYLLYYVYLKHRAYLIILYYGHLLHYGHLAISLLCTYD